MMAAAAPRLPTPLNFLNLSRSSAGRVRRLITSARIEPVLLEGIRRNLLKAFLLMHFE
jgi:hypothetical protein